MITANEIIDRINIVNQSMKQSLCERSPEDSINEFIRSIGRSLRACGIFIYVAACKEKYRCVFHWKDGSVPVVDEMKAIDEHDLVPEWWETIHGGKIVFATDMEAYRESCPTAYEQLRRVGIQSVVVCPVILENELYGFVVFSNPAAEFMQSGDSIYEIVANYIGIMLRHRKNSNFINELTHYDKVTGLYNLNIFHHNVARITGDVSRGALTGAWDVICFNISNFKVVNDQRGYAAGDELLRDMAALLMETVGKDNLTRGHADHFYCIVEDVRAEDVIQSAHDAMLRNVSGRVDIYAGIYTMTGREKDAAEAMGYAELASDEASNDFVKYYRRFVSQMADREKRNAYIIKNVDEAIENGWIKVYYQPVYGTLSRKVYSFEALARWVDPKYGFMNPGEFIYVLEEAHLLYKVDLYMLEQVCRDIERLDRAGVTMHASVNISRNDLDVPGFHQSVNAILGRYHVWHDAIAMEITESALVDHEDMIQQHISIFHEDGYEVWLDDFGSGYSSLNALQHFDFDMMKIDMMFLRNPTSRTEDILKDVIDMSKKLGISCLTEGVETEEQMKFLMDTGCSYIQGYYISRPKPMEEIETMMKQSGLETETKSDRRFFNEIAHTNLMFRADPYIGKGYEPSEDPKIVSIIEQINGKLKTIYTNETGTRWLTKQGIKTEEERNRSNDKSEINAYVALREGIRKLRRRGDVTEEYFHDAIFPGKMRIQLITVFENRRAFLVTGFRNDNIAADFNFEDLAGGVPSAVFIYKAYGDENILFANQKCFEMFGCVNMAEFMDVTKGSFHSLVHPDDIARIEDSIWRQINDPKNANRGYLVFRATKKDGTEMLLLGAGQLISHKTYGDVFFALLFERDTQTKIWQNALKKRERLRLEAKEGGEKVIRLSALEAAGFIEDMASVFDMARLVDFKHSKVLRIEEDGVMHYESGQCFDVWNARTNCRTCISRMAYETKSQAARIDMIEGNMVAVMARYLEIEGQPHVMELAYKVKANGQIPSETRENLIKYLGGRILW